MKKIETIWHFLLNEALTKKQFKHTQKDLAFSFNYSLSTINRALVIPSQIGAVKKSSKFFLLSDFQKLLYLWASLRNLEKDIIYQTRIEVTINEIEGLIPSQAIYAGYSAAKRILKEPPADYSKVYFYIDKESLDQVSKRFPPSKEHGAENNVFVLPRNPKIPGPSGFTTLPLTFVDVWNLKDWYSKDFILALEEKIHGILS